MAAQSGKLTELVELNELVKQTITLSQDVELTSMNALLANKSSGLRSGFSAVTNELLSFSSTVTQVMNELSGLFAHMIQQAANELNQIRAHRIFQDATRKSTIAQQVLHQTQIRLNQSLEHTTRQFRQFCLRATRLLEGLERHCVVGSGLACAGKIEATYSGKLRAMLYQISGNIGQLMMKIFQCIQELKEKISRYIR